MGMHVSYTGNRLCL